MGAPGAGSSITPEDVRGVFSGLDDPTTPLTTRDVTQRLDCATEAVEAVLEELVDDGDLRSRDVGESTRIWWYPDGYRDATGPDTTEFDTFVSTVQDYAIFTLDPDGTVASWNEGAQRIKGYDEADIVGEHFSTFYTAEDVEAGVPDRNLDAAATNGRVEDEGWRVREDGSRFWANVVITAVRDDDGELQGFTKVTRDMTERREYEEQLRQERDLVEQILETAPTGIGVLDAEGRFVRANAQLLERHGIDESDLGEYGLPALEIYDTDGEPLSRADWPLSRIVETGEPVFDFQCQAKPPDGERVWLSINGAPLEDEATDEPRVIAAVEDITEQKERERQLRRERDQTEQLLRTAPIAIAVQNAEGDTILANQRAQEALGISEQEIIEQTEDADEWGVYDPDGNPIPPEEMPAARVVASGESVFDEEIVLDPPEGDRMHFRLNAAPVRDAEGAIDRVITTGEDITQLRKRERQLQQRKTELETELSEILGRISDAFYALDTEWRFTHLNDSAAEIIGRSEEELLDAEIWTVLPEAPDVYREHFERAMETQEPITFDEYVEELDSWLEFNLYPSESGLSVYFRDVSVRKKHDRALRERERQLSRYKEYTDDILDSIDDVFYLLDRDGELQRWNRSLSQVTGYSPDAIASMHAIDFFEESEHETVGDAIAEGFETGDIHLIANIVTSDGDSIPYEFAASTLEDPEGRPVLAGIGRDITDRREYERKLEESNERLEQFAYAASHDLQEPLRMVSSYLQLVDRRYGDELDEDGREFIEYAVDGAERMQAMIDGLLEYSRVETRGDPFETVDLDAVVDDVRADLAMRIEETDAELTIDPLPSVQGDPDQLRQVFQNLFDNAIEYSGGEPPRIDVSAERDGDEWLLSVRDEGIGIEPDDQDRIFEVFQRLHTQEEHAGTGIGLALCRRIVERHGGDIWVDSEPGEGTTFAFTLPAQ